MSHGIKVSRDGYDALTANDENLLMNTDEALLKVKSQGAGSVVFTGADGLGSTKTATITHSLGHKPIAMINAERAPGSRRKLVLGNDINDISGGDKVSVDAKITATTVVLTFTSVVASPTGTYNYYYYVFYDPIQ